LPRDEAGLVDRETVVDQQGIIPKVVRPVLGATATLERIAQVAGNF
jgi:hypothetical protein